MPTASCPKCNGEMEPGLIPDAGYTAVRWRPASEAKGFLDRLKTLRTSGYPITADRCKTCGFLEMYGRKPPE